MVGRRCQRLSGRVHRFLRSGGERSGAIIRRRRP